MRAMAFLAPSIAAMGRSYKNRGPCRSAPCARCSFPRARNRGHGPLLQNSRLHKPFATATHLHNFSSQGTPFPLLSRSVFGQ